MAKMTQPRIPEEEARSSNLTPIHILVCSLYQFSVINEMTEKTVAEITRRIGMRGRNEGQLRFHPISSGKLQSEK
jgi:hypothetical protein